MKETILVTGGSNGIGFETLRLLSQNYFVYNLDFQKPKEALENTKWIPIDLSKSLEETKLEISKLDLGKISGLVGVVHVAGFGGPYETIEKVQTQTYEKILNTNLTSLVAILQIFLPILAKNQFGRIVAIASSLSLVGSKNSAIYSASKHALVGLIRSVADEWGSYNITANCISPGFVNTKMGIREEEVQDHLKSILEKTPSKKIAEPFEIARVVEFLLKRESDYVNGANWTVDGGITAI